MSATAVQEYFDARAADWDQKSEPAGIKHLMIAQLAGISEGARVVDVGCGTGIMERAYLELGAQQIVALDVSEQMIQHARHQFAHVPAEQLRFVCADVIDFSRQNEAAANAQFDAVVIYNAYPHIKNTSELVIAVHNLLKPEGRFLVAHGMGRAALDEHHATVPADISRSLGSAEEEARLWNSLFTIDMTADTPYLYFFGGTKRS